MRLRSDHNYLILFLFFFDTLHHFSKMGNIIRSKELLRAIEFDSKYSKKKKKEDENSLSLFYYFQDLELNSMI